MQLAATLAVVASVLVFAYQARELARQTRMGNQVAGTSAHREIAEFWRRWSSVFIQHPELHAYYFDETEATPSDADNVRLKIIAEQHGDFLEMGLLTSRQLASYGDYNWIIGDWDEYVAITLAGSPVLRSFLRENPRALPSLVEHVAIYDNSREED
jgi:hypothetical protein